MNFKFFFRELPFFSVLAYVLMKLITFFYIYAHNYYQVEQWPYALLWRNQDIEKSFMLLLSPLLLAPVIETLFFCVGIWHLCQKLRLHRFFFIISSAGVFGAYHLFGEGKGIYTFMYTFAGGCVFAYVFQQKIQQHKEMTAFICVVLVHALANFLSVMI